RLSRLQRHSLRCLMAAYRRTQGEGAAWLVMSASRRWNAIRAISATACTRWRREGCLSSSEPQAGRRMPSTSSRQKVKNWFLKLNKVVIKRKYKHKQSDREPQVSLICPSKEPCRVQSGGV